VQDSGPIQRLEVPGGGGLDREFAEFTADGIDRDQCVGGLMRIYTDDDHGNCPS
jgi:hypothetical protein